MVPRSVSFKVIKSVTREEGKIRSGVLICWWPLGTIHTSGWPAGSVQVAQGVRSSPETSVTSRFT